MRRLIDLTRELLDVLLWVDHDCDNGRDAGCEYCVKLNQWEEELERFEEPL